MATRAPLKQHIAKREESMALLQTNRLSRPRLEAAEGRTGRDGTGRDGTGRDGTGRDGTGRDGTGRDGTGRDGMGWDGTGQSDSQLQNNMSNVAS